MKIGIYGGSFNPIHKGHTALAASILQQRLVDEVWLLVSPLNPLKQEAASHIAAYEHRLNMARLATEKMDGVHVSDIERHLPVPSYTITTLSQLRKAHPQHEFALVIGADNWERFPKWHHAQEILDTCHIFVYRRPRSEIDPSALPPTVQVVETPLYDISSTEIRECVQRGEDINEWVDEKVTAYIKAHELYRRPEENMSL